MGKTKKEHYVPQCYLKNFMIPGTDEKIDVFDKSKVQVRLKQNILDNASERYFYDIDIDKILAEASEDKRISMMEQLGENYDVYKNDKEQHLEKFFSNVIEGDYSRVLKSIISKAENASPWYIKNCYCMSEEEQVIMAVCITMQFWRTKKQRVMLEEGITKFSTAMLCKLYNIEYGDKFGRISKEDFETTIGKEAMKLQHAEFILNIENILEFSAIFLRHIWVIYINRTDEPFWTSDAPVALNPMPNGWRSGKGIASRGIEIVLPLSDKVAWGMYDAEMYAPMLSLLSNRGNRMYLEIKDKEQIQRFNQLQVIESYRCVYSSSDDFSIAQSMCKEHPNLKQDKEYFSVG